MTFAGVLGSIKRGLQGKPLLSHPVHVALVHFPATLFPASWVFDLMATRGGTWKQLGMAGYYANLFGLGMGVPTALTGVAEWWDIPRDHPSWKLATTHAALNDTILAIGTYNWLSRRSRRNFAADRTNLLLGALSTTLMGTSNWIGGLLSYEHGLGVQRQGKALDTKRQNEAWERDHGHSKPASEADQERLYGVAAVPEADDAPALGADI